MTGATGPRWRIRSVAPATRDGLAGLVTDLELDGRREELWFGVDREHEGAVRASPDPALVGMLVPALFHGATIESALPVSVAVLRRVRRVEGLFLGWLPADTRPIQVNAPAVERQGSKEGMTALTFFGGGVDSIDTALRHLAKPLPGFPPLTHAVHVRDYAYPHRRRDDDWAGVIRGLGLTPIAGRTNLHQLFPIEFDWHVGTALAAFAHVLNNRFCVAFIPSSQSYAAERAIGNSPVVDEACSTGWLRIHHDGAEATRAEKIRRSIAGSPLALETLSCCPSESGKPVNCGRCAKCRETMLGLAAAGALARAGTLPTALPPDFFRSWPDLTPAPLQEALATARASGNAPLASQLERLLPRVAHRNALRHLFEVMVLRRGVRKPLPRKRPSGPQR